jgi:hypothetical protein
MPIFLFEYGHIFLNFLKLNKYKDNINLTATSGIIDTL